MLGGAGYAAWLYVEPLLPKPQPPAPVALPAPPPSVVAPPPPLGRLRSSLPTTRKIALIMFPLDAHAFDGKTDLGMMPVTLELKPGESKTIDVARKMYVRRTVRIDGTKPRVVIGLVSNAVAAKRKGMSQEEQEALADRAAAETVVLEESEAPGSIPEVTDTRPTSTAKGKKARPAASEATETDEAP